MSQGISILVFPQTMLHQHLVWESCVCNCAYGNNVWYCETHAGHHLRTKPKHVHICPFLLPIHFFCSFSSLQLHVFKKLVKGYYSASLPFTISCSYYLLSLKTYLHLSVLCVRINLCLIWSTKQTAVYQDTYSVCVHRNTSTYIFTTSLGLQDN